MNRMLPAGTALLMLINAGVPAHAAHKRATRYQVPVQPHWFGSGARIDEVDANSPAARAGMRPGDVVIGVNGSPVNSMYDIQCGAKRASAHGRRQPGRNPCQAQGHAAAREAARDHRNGIWVRHRRVRPGRSAAALYSAARTGPSDSAAAAHAPAVLTDPRAEPWGRSRRGGHRDETQASDRLHRSEAALVAALAYKFGVYKNI